MFSNSLTSNVLINDLFVCKYDDDKIGLFKKYNYKIDKKREFGFTYYDALEIYVGLDNDKVGVKVTHDFDIFTNFWADNGYEIHLPNNYIITNCQIKKSKSITDIRIIMYLQGLITNINSGVLTEEELSETIDFTKDFYRRKKVKTK